jgi:hypothetical protein
MARRIQLLLAIVLLGLLGVVLALDPRVENYQSRYDPPATQAEIARWARDLQAWRASPTWEEFPAKSPAPEFVGSYVFGKYRYRLDIQITGERMQCICWSRR